MIDWFHSNGIRVVLWATSVLNVDTPLYNYAKKQNYFLNDGATQKWWHGVGSWIDYTNDDAVDWWHKQMDLVLDQGVDGFKNDGTDPYVFLFLPYAYGKKGVVSEREYAEAYYRDFLFYSRTKNPQAITWARPCDSYGTPDCIKFAPKDVMFSGWVGDQVRICPLFFLLSCFFFAQLRLYINKVFDELCCQRGSFEGMQGALYNYLRSAWDGYLNYGSDIGGYLNDNGNPLGRTKEVFIRWAQLGAFSPLMENGGNGEHRPWMFDTAGETVDIYRTFVHYHVELTPYFLSTATEKFSQYET
jgi:alpha-glucosidase (family GH31 glycosyl hydrolase)